MIKENKLPEVFDKCLHSKDEGNELNINIAEITRYKLVFNKDRKQVALCFDKPVQHFIMDKVTIIDLIRILSQNLSQL